MKAHLQVMRSLVLRIFSALTAVFGVLICNETAASSIKLPSYADQQAWKDIEQFLPEKYHISETGLPAEEWWRWQGNQIHLDAYRNPQAKIKVILLHGVGTNGRQMSMILGSQLAQRGYETIAPDLPGYGLSQVLKPRSIRYDDWVQLSSDLINAERQRDARPIVLYGLSAGGMLTYHAAVKNPQVKAIAGMTFIDTQEASVRDQISRNVLISRAGTPLAHIGAKTPLSHLKLPMRWVSKMSALVNDPKALHIFLKDKSSAGNAVSIGFLDSYLNYRPNMAPENFDTAPILLLQPQNDRWTPLSLSLPFLDKIKRVPVQKVILDQAGHYPLEQPGLDQMADEIDQFYRQSTVTK